MQITNDNIPHCQKCDENALTLHCGVWLCGQCFANYIEKQRKLQEKMILEE